MTATTRPFALNVTVAAEDLSYPVVVGAGMLDRLGAEVHRVEPKVRRVAVVSDETVMRLYGAQARASLEAAGMQVDAWAVEPGERQKTPHRMLELVGELVDAGLGRRDLVVALGGGVVGDLAGLVAALFMRGVAFVQCPTTLLAQVDASVGGKVAVDLPQGKNLLGAFHFPRAVVIDPTVLVTLPDAEVACGVAEMLKHGLLFSREHYADLLDGADAIYERDADLVARLVATSVALKAACVSRDPREAAVSGKGRALLNLGHTVGHAIEAAANFELGHGQAVALGLRAAARLSDRHGVSDGTLETTTTGALERLRLPTDLDAWLVGERARAVEAALANDKKRVGDTITYIALTEIGQPRVLALPPNEILGLLRPS